MPIIWVALSDYISHLKIPSDIEISINSKYPIMTIFSNFHAPKMYVI